MPYTYESPVTEKLAEFADRGPRDEEMRLDAATSFDWDIVFYFLDGTPKKDINETVGLTLFANESGRYYEHGPLLVFRRGDEIVHAVAIMPPLFISGTYRGSYRPDEAILIAHTKDPGPYSLRFSDY
ncbi:MAG: hypothetical protein ACR2QH_16485 [Geminicoccaceae bacterium]